MLVHEREPDSPRETLDCECQGPRPMVNGADRRVPEGQQPIIRTYCKRCNGIVPSSEKYNASPNNLDA